MLEQLTIRNFAIIDDLSISFDTGFNVFTGETGAGKSIIIDALSLLTGERASASYVRYGAKKAFVEGVFSLSEKQFNKINDIVTIDENVLVITKEVDENGKSTNKINGRMTTLSIIKSIMNDILDIHSQNDNQYLLDHRYHLSLLDSFGGEEIERLKRSYQEVYAQYIELLKRQEYLKSLVIDEEEIDYLHFQIKEIEDADIHENELEDLEEEKRRMSQFEKISTKVDGFVKEYDNLSSSLYAMKKYLDSLGSDSMFEDYSSTMNDLYYQLDELVENVKSSFSDIDYSYQRMEEIQQRIYQIQKISKKHGPTYADIMLSLEEMKKKLDSIENVDLNLRKTEKEIENVYNQLLLKGNELEKLRDKYGLLLKESIIKELRDLYLAHAQFELIFTPNAKPLKEGLRNVSFYVSMNPGQPVQPLVKIASGGEISRLMLGLKIICNKLFGISTTIFDEVDVGVSGMVARAMGLKMLNLGNQMQVIAITHLPQVASLGDSHYHVEKIFVENNTKTVVTKLDSKRREIEIAKMLSGEINPSDNAVNQAKELLKI